MRSVAEARDEVELWVRWAMAAENLANGLRLRDPDAARALEAQVLALPPEKKGLGMGVTMARGETQLHLVEMDSSIKIPLKNSGKEPSLLRLASTMLRRSDVGIAMGTGTDVAIESAGVTLLKGDLQGIVRARRLWQATVHNIRQNLFFAFLQWRGRADCR